MDNINKFAGSVSTEDFINGLLGAAGVESLGDVWERLQDCNHCPFVKQCNAIGEYFDNQDKNPSCGHIISFMLGELKEEDIK